MKYIGMNFLLKFLPIQKRTLPIQMMGLLIKLVITSFLTATSVWTDVWMCINWEYAYGCVGTAGRTMWTTTGVTRSRGRATSHVNTSSGSTGQCAPMSGWVFTSTNPTPIKLVIILLYGTNNWTCIDVLASIEYTINRCLYNARILLTCLYIILYLELSANRIAVN